jgi:hypothetical protein
LTHSREADSCGGAGALLSNGNLDAGRASTKGAAAAAPDDGDPATFLAAKKFTGAREGYVFQKGPQGTGYYVDRYWVKSEKQFYPF